MGESSMFRSLREWTPMTRLLQQIPLKAQRGLFTHDLSITCVDCLPDYLVLGTNVGLVYWYDRRKDELQRLRCENTSSPIVCIRVVSALDFMVAAGSEDGHVSVFQIPKPGPASVTPTTAQSRQIERFTISGLHLGPVSALEWSPNGTNLFSGDRLGIIVLTEIDFYMHLSKSREVLNEKYEVVQLSYYCGAGVPNGKLLLVSTVYRTTLCSWKPEERSWKVTQLGQRERKMLGQFGATVYHPTGMGSACHNQTIFASRPGLRLWQAGLDGVVQQTLIFKDALMCPHPSIMLVNPVPSRFKQAKVSAEKNAGRKAETYESVERRAGVDKPDNAGFQHQLGYLHPFSDGLLVAHWKGPSGSLLVLDPEDTGIIASVKTGPGGLRSIISVAVTPIATKPLRNVASQDVDSLEQGPEIFVLEGGRSLIRIANLPDYHYSKAGLEEQDDSLGSSVRSLFSSTIFSPSLLPSPPPILKDLTSSFLELTTGSSVNRFKGGGESSSSSRGDAGSSTETIDNPTTSPPDEEEGLMRGKVPKHLGVVMADEALELPPVLGLPFDEIPGLLTSSTEGAQGEMSSLGSVEGCTKTSGLGSSPGRELMENAGSLASEEILCRPKKQKRKKKRSSTVAPPILEPGGGIYSEGVSSRSTGSEEDTSLQAAPAAKGHPEGHQGVAWQETREEAAKKEETLRMSLLEQAKRNMGVQRRKGAEVMSTTVNLRSSVVEEGHIGVVEAWLPSMPLAPDLRSPTSIMQDVESKGELLAKLLDLKPIIPQPSAQPTVEQRPDLPSHRSPHLVAEGHSAESTSLAADAELSPNEPMCWFLDTSVDIGTAEHNSRKRRGKKVIASAGGDQGGRAPRKDSCESCTEVKEGEGQLEITADDDLENSWEVIDFI